jgi:hypothetical protein
MPISEFQPAQTSAALGLSGNLHYRVSVADAGDKSLDSIVIPYPVSLEIRNLGCPNVDPLKDFMQLQA